MLIEELQVKDARLKIRDEEVILSAGRGMFWVREKALVIADMHLGKTAHFRKFGIPVPASLLDNDLCRLTDMIGTYQPQKLIVVGDMFHQKDINTDIGTFTNWRNSFDKLGIILVQGNHDKLKTLQYMHMNIQLYNPNLTLHPFRFIHEYREKHEEFFSISGHIHPGVLLRGRARQALKLPCFALGSDQLVLPAFSLFTGLDLSYCVNECDFYAIANNEVFRVAE